MPSVASGGMRSTQSSSSHTKNSSSHASRYAPKWGKIKLIKVSAVSDPRAIHSPSSSTIKEAAAGKSMRRVNSGLDVFIVDIPFHVPNPIFKVAVLFAQAFRAYYSHFAENVHS